jgi:HAE1 family hydrophobic/amphiphilic exporter-1
MSMAHDSIKRPVLTAVIFLVIITLGLVSYNRLSIDLMPETTYPTISVFTDYGNVGPQEMEELVTRPLEESLAAVQGVEEITSSSTEGRSSVRVSFIWGTDLDVAANDIRDRLDRAMSRLPEDIERPTIRKFDLSAFPIMFISVASNMNPLELRQLVEDQVKYRIERVDGVAAVNINGGLKREIHIDLHAAQIKALGLSPDDIITALQNENRNIPAGLYDKGNLEVLIRTQGEFRSLEEIRNTVITMRQGSPIQVKDVAEVVDSWEEVRDLNRVNGKPGLRMSINKQSGANTVTVAEATRQEIEAINRDFPQIQLIPQFDSSVYIKQSISNVGSSTIYGGILAILILFLFLRNISSTVIIATAIPISIIATFGLMYFGGFTLNIITFGGLALGIGMLVDNAIVVLENTFRHRELGVSPIDSAVVGAAEVSSAIVSSTLTTVVVFFPVVFIRGMSGIMFQQMAYVVTFSLMCSLLVALTLVPMLSSRFLHYRPAAHQKGESTLQKIYATSEAIFIKVEKRYADFLQKSIKRRKQVVIATAALFIVSIILIRFIGVELMPKTDESEVRLDIETAVGSQLEVVDQATLAIEEVVRRQVPEMVMMSARIGGGGSYGGGGHSSEIRVALKPIAERTRSSEQVANDLRKAVSGIPGVTVRTRAGQGMSMLRMGASTGDAINVEVRGYNLETAQALALQVDQLIREVPGITDTKISREEGSPEQIIRIDRQKAADLGLSVVKIGEALQTTVGGTYASYYRDGGKEYRILVRLCEEDRKNLADLLDLSIVNNRGVPVVLRNVVSAEPQEGPVRLERKDQERIITIAANFTGRDMGSVVKDIRERTRTIPLPRDFAILFGGDYEEQQKAFSELMLALVLAIFLVYLVMAAQFESFLDPLIVLFSIPMAVIGVVVTMIFTGTIFSLQAFIGCIMLAGIVVNNAILLVDYTNQLRHHEKMELLAAIALAGSRRLRPILMTTLTTVLGLLPLSFGFGEGGETQAPMARVVIGGLTSSTLVTLILVPIIYSLFEERISSKKKNTTT